VSKSRIIRGAGHVERIGEGGGAYWFGEKKNLDYRDHLEDLGVMVG